MAALISVILTQLLSPDRCKMVDVIAVFVALTGAFIDSKFKSTLVRGGGISNISCSSMLCFGITLSIMLCLVLFFYTPLVSVFCKSNCSVLAPILQILKLHVVLTTIGSIRDTCISGGVVFGRFFVSALNTAITSTIIKVCVTCTKCNI